MPLSVLVVVVALWSVGGLAEEKMGETDGKDIVINVIPQMEKQVHAANLEKTQILQNAKKFQRNLSDTPITIHA